MTEHSQGRFRAVQRLPPAPGPTVDTGSAIVERMAVSRTSVARLASLAVLSRHQHRRRAAYQVLALLTGNRPARSP